ncbi:MAG: glycosyltransferase family 2 protein [Actinobacteria bacterium]|nr:glycosyltransferase family 2 protein [Actinomycetota bacterium]
MNPQVRARESGAPAYASADESSEEPATAVSLASDRPVLNEQVTASAADLSAGLDADPPADEEAIPPVVIVMVAHDPGWWFDETLSTVAAQTYGNWSLLVIDADSTTDLEAPIAQHVPGAHLQRLDANPGFGAAVNEVLTSVQGAAFYLICHDDVRLDADTLQNLVEEAYRSNAGVVGPKLVSWFQPDQLLQVGLGADKTGVPANLVDRGELDQEQHDAVRDVFLVPGACTLIRADLFDALQGFDPGIDFHADDLDLCWRAHLAGSRVLIAPGARVAHLEALGERRPENDRRRLQMRHRLRAVKSNYSWFTRVRVIPQAAVLAIVEIVYAVIVGRFRQARDVAGAWLWNMRRRGEIRERRKLVKATRIARDRDIRRLQVRGSARLSAYLRGQIGTDQDRLGAMAASSRQFATNLRSGRATSALIAWGVLIAVWLIGSRSLLTSGVPTVGEFARFPSSSVSLLQEWFSGYRNAGLGSTAPAPTSFGVLGGVGFLAFGSMGVVRNVLILAMLPLGAIGIWRLCRPIGSRRAKIVGLLTYAAIPVGYNSFSEARWSGLVMYGAAPWMLAILLRASRVAPFGSIGGMAGPGVPDRPLLHHIVSLGFVTALAALLVPFAVDVVVGFAVALAVGGLLVGQVRGALRLVGTAIGASVVAFVFHLPWSLDFLQPDWQLVTGASALASHPLDLGAVLRFDTGDYGSSSLAYGVLVAAALPLLVGRDWRLGWAARAWVVALAGFGIVWAAAMGWLPFNLPPAEVILAPVAAAISVATAMGMASFEVDLPDYHFGWRQLASVFAAAALVLTAAPVLNEMIDGAWGLPPSDFTATLTAVDGETAATPSRVLWMGDADVLPLRGWALTDPRVRGSRDGAVVAYGTSDRALPQVQSLYPGSPGGATQQLTDAVNTAAGGGTSRLGSLLAPMGIKYVIVPDRLGPAPFVANEQAPSPRLLAVLDAQLDLTTVEINKSMRIYRNVAWGPVRARLPADARVPTGGDARSDRVLPAITNAPVALSNDGGFASYSGDLPQPSTVYLGNSTTGWELQVNGSAVERRDALGWANAFPAGAGRATMQFLTPATRPLALVGEMAVWVLGAFYLLRTRVARDERRRLGSHPPGAEAETFSAGGEPDGDPDAGRRASRRRRRHRSDETDPLEVIA